MYNYLYEEIKNRISLDKKYVSSKLINSNYLLLIYLKYLCKNSKNYMNIEKLSSIIPNDKLYLYEDFFDKKLNELLCHLELSNILDLIKEYIDKTKFDTCIDIENIFINNNNVLYLICKSDYTNLKVITNLSLKDAILYKEQLEIIDNILNKKRNIYTDIKDTNLSDIDTLVVIDKEPAYKYFSPTNIIDIIYNIIEEKKEFNGKIILKTSYSKISIIKREGILKKFLSKVLLYEDSKNNECILVFDKEIKEYISIIMIDKNIEKDYKEIKNLIINDIENEKNLIKVTPENIIKNNKRIGFKMYLPSKNEEAKSINDIIDENTKILENINRLNKLIQEEMDKLVTK